MVVKIKASYESFCFKDYINLDINQGVFKNMKGITYEKVFPQYDEPAMSRTLQHPDFPNLNLMYFVKVPEQEDVPNLCQQFALHEAVEYAEPLYAYQSFFQPNDPLADTTAGINEKWHLDVIQAREAWEIVRNDTSVVVAIVDEGYTLTHPDMRDNIMIKHDDPIDGIDNDLDGYQDNYRGWDFGGSTLISTASIM